MWQDQAGTLLGAPQARPNAAATDSFIGVVGRPISADRTRVSCERMLAQTLQWLESDGLVDRIAFNVVPPHVEYRLTPLGLEAAEKVRGLADWIETSLPRLLQAQDSRRQKPSSGPSKNLPAA